MLIGALALLFDFRVCVCKHNIDTAVVETCLYACMHRYGVIIIIALYFRRNFINKVNKINDEQEKERGYGTRNKSKKDGYYNNDALLTLWMFCYGCSQTLFLPHNLCC